MSDRMTTEVQKVENPGNTVPAFLADYAKTDSSLESLRQYRVLSRISIGQPLSKICQPDSTGKIQVPAGAVFISPLKVILANLGEAFQIVPLFNFTEFIHWRDRDDKAGTRVIAKTFDPTSDIAQRSRDEKRRIEVYPGSTNPTKPWVYSYVENNSFVVQIRACKDPSLVGQLSVIAYNRGEFFNGAVFSTAIGVRGGTLWGQVWEMRSAVRNGAKGIWYGLDHKVPAEGPWIRNDEADSFRNLHEELKKDFAAKRLEVVASDEGEESGISKETAASSKFAGN